MDTKSQSNVQEESQMTLEQEVLRVRTLQQQSPHALRGIFAHLGCWSECPEEELVKKYHKLIVKIVAEWYNKFPGKTYDFEDLYGLGITKLFYAWGIYQERGDENKASFVTYFVHSFMNAMKDLLKKSYKTILVSMGDSEEGPEKVSEVNLFELISLKDDISMVQNELRGLSKIVFNHLVKYGRTPATKLATIYNEDLRDVRNALSDVRMKFTIIKGL